MNECDRFPAGSTHRAICRGEIRDLEHCNFHRKRWGMAPLTQAEFTGSGETAAPPLQPIMVRGVNFARAMAKWMLSGFPTRSKRAVRAVLGICQSCEHYEPERVRCDLCGCCLDASKLINKITLKTEHCPEGKW